MCNTQKDRITFAGGLEARRITSGIVEQLRGLRINSMFIGFDTWTEEAPFARAMKILGDFPRDKLRAFVLIGRDGIEEDTKRLVRSWELGALPFAQLFQPADRIIDYSMEYKRLAKVWSRPAFIKAAMKEAERGKQPDGFSWDADS